MNTRNIEECKGHVPPHENSRISCQSLADEFPATLSGRLRLCGIVINRQLPFPERFVSHDEGEELVGTTKGNHILCFAEV